MIVLRLSRARSFHAVVVRDNGGAAESETGLAALPSSVFCPVRPLGSGAAPPPSLLILLPSRLPFFGSLDVITLTFGAFELDLGY